MKLPLFRGFMLVTAIAACGAVNATILTFDQVRIAGGSVVSTISGLAVPQDYGDRVNAASMNVAGGQFTYGNGGEGFTPNILVEYFTTANGPGTSLWEDSYGDLTNVLFGNQNSESLNIRFSADTGVSVNLYGFDLAGWPNADYIINAVRVIDLGTELFSASDVLVEGNATGARHTSFAFSAPLRSSELLIQIDYSNLAGSQQDNIGVDNVRFGQDGAPDDGPSPLPEPTTTLLLALGAAAYVRGTRSRRLCGSRA